MEYLIDRIFDTNRCLFAFTSVACSTFNFNEKVASSTGFDTIYWYISGGLLFWPTLYSVRVFISSAICRFWHGTSIRRITTAKRWRWQEFSFKGYSHHQLHFVGGHHCPKTNPTWLTVAILKIAMTSVTDDPIQIENHKPTTFRTLWKFAKPPYQLICPTSKQPA